MVWVDILVFFLTQWRHHSPECRAGMCSSATASVDTTALTPGGSLSHIQAATTENALQENAEPNIGGGG